MVASLILKSSSSATSIFMPFNSIRPALEVFFSVAALFGVPVTQFHNKGGSASGFTFYPDGTVMLLNDLFCR